MKKVLSAVLLAVFALSLAATVAVSKAEAKLPDCTVTCKWTSSGYYYYICCPKYVIGDKGKKWDWVCYWDYSDNCLP